MASTRLPDKLAPWLPPLAVLGSILSLTVGTSYGKHLFAVVGAQGTATFRVVFASVILLCVWRPWRMSLPMKSAKAIALYGATLGLMNLSFYMSLATLPLGIAIAIEFTGPLTVAIIASRRPIDFLWIAFAILGLGLLLPITPSAASISPIGVAYALLSAVLWALYIVFGKRVGNIHAGQSTSLGMLVASLVVLPFGIARAGAELINPALLGPAIALAILSSAIPYSLEMFALQRMPKNTFGILCSMEPAVGAVAALFILGEQLTVLQWIAISAIILASVGTSLSAKSDVQENLTPADVPADAL